MYKLNYYEKSIAGNASEIEKFEYVDTGESFRLRRNALHYLFDIVQSEYRENGYTTEVRVGSLYCYKREKTILIKVER